MHKQLKQVNNCNGGFHENLPRLRSRRGLGVAAAGVFVGDSESNLD